MIQLNKLNDTEIQVIGTHEGIKVNGFAHKVSVKGNQNKVWQYELKLMRHPRQVNVSSHPNEGTLWDEERLLARIVQVCEEFESN